MISQCLRKYVESHDKRLRWKCQQLPEEDLGCSPVEMGVGEDRRGFYMTDSDKSK